MLLKEFKVLAGVRWSYLKNEDTEVKDFLKGTETPTVNSGFTSTRSISKSRINL